MSVREKSVVIQGGTVIDPHSNREGLFDLLLEKGHVKAVEKPGTLANVAGAEYIDAGGQWVLPGLIDLHVHLREPGYEWKETIASGAQAAALGGFTSICCMPNTNPANDNAEITKFILEKGREAGAARVLPIGAVSLKREGKVMAPYSEMRAAGCVAFSDDGDPVFDAGLMRRALEWCKMLDIPIACHEEDRCLSCGGVMRESGLSARLGLKGWPALAEEVMVARDIEISRATGAKVHICHVSTARSVELVRRAKNDGFAVTAEVTPQHLLLTQEAVGEYDTNAKLMPPFGTEEDRLALIAGVRDGTLDTIASDHAPHDRDSKEVEFSRASVGILGLQTNLPLVLELVRAGAISRNRFVEAFTSAPAKAFGLQGGTLSPGAVADVVIVDPEYQWKLTKEGIHSLSTNTPFLGRPLQGAARTVLIGGSVVVQQGKLGNSNR